MVEQLICNNQVPSSIFGAGTTIGDMRARCSKSLENSATERLMVRFLVSPPFLPWVRIPPLPAEYGELAEWSKALVC